MELITNTACLLCKQQTTVLKLDNVKSYLDKLFDTFFDKSNIFKDEFQGMVANASLCLMCTPKVNICCNLRNDYEDKYNGKCLQKLFSTAGCLLCDGNLTPLTKTQDMPSSLLQQIELFMNSTSFPESYSNSALCLTCIHSLNIWHEVRSSIMKLRQNEEVDENNDANECTDSDATDITNSTKSAHLNSKKVETKYCTPDDSNVEKENVIDLADSDAESIEKVDNEGKSATQTSLKTTEKVVPDDETDDIQSKENLSDHSRSESPSLLNNKFGKKFRHQQKIQKLSLGKNVKNKESLISDSSDSEIDDLNKIVEEIVESYKNEEAILNQDSFNAKSSNKQSISEIDNLSDSENQLNSTQKSLSKTSNVSPSKSTSSRWISKKKTLIDIMSDSSDSESATKEKKTNELKRRRLSTFSEDNTDDEGKKIDDSSDGERPQKNTVKLNRSKPNLESESSKRKRSDNDDEEKTTKIDNSSDEEHPQKNTQKLNRSRLLALSKGTPEHKVSKHKKLDDKDRGKLNETDNSSDEGSLKRNTQKLNRSRLLTLSKGTPERQVSKHKKPDDKDRGKLTETDDSSDEGSPKRKTQKLNRSRLLTLSKGTPERKVSKHKKSDDKDRGKLTETDDSSDEGRPQKNTRKLNRSKLLTSLNESSESEGSEHKKSDNGDQEKITEVDDSSNEERPQKNTRKLNRLKLSSHKRSDNKERMKTTKIDDSSSEDDEIIKDGKKQKPKIILKLKTQEHEKSKTEKQIKKSEDASDTGSTQNSQHKRQSTRLEAQMAIIDDSSDNESDHSPSLAKNRKIRKSETRNNRKSENGKDKSKLDDSSDSESTGTESTQKSKDSKNSFMADNGKSDRDLELETTTVNDSSDSESTSNLADNNQSSRSKTRTSKQKNQKRLRRLQISSETKTNRGEASRTSDSSDEFESKSTRRKRSLRKLPSPPKIVLSDSSDEENIHTLSSKSMTTTNSENNEKHDSRWLYLNKKLNHLQSVKKLHKNKNINLPDARLDDKFYKQLPYVLLEKNVKAQKTKTVKEKKEFSKLKLQKSKPVDKENDRRSSREPVDKENDRRSSRRINKSPITITLSDDESQDTMNSSFIEIQTMRCRICDKISKTFCECKAHDLFHKNPQQVVINVVRENLKQLQEKYRSASNNIDKIITKYIDISEKSVGELQETISNGHSSGNSSVEVEDEELQLVKDSTSKSHIPLPNEKSSSTSEDNSDCENVPNVVNEKKRKLSILLNNSRDKSDNSSPNPKRVRFALDHKTSIPNSQSTEDLTKTKSKYSCVLI